MKKSNIFLTVTLAALNFQLLIFNCSAQYTQLLHFGGSGNGHSPYGSLISEGTFLYGLTSEGGVNSNGGTLFIIRPNGTDYLEIINFTGINGYNPHGSLISDGTFLYGMTSAGGTGTCPNGCGVIFKINSDLTGYTKLLDFQGTTNGSVPYGSLLLQGTFLYGMTVGGGINDLGTVFKIKTDGTGYSKLLDLSGTPNGNYPQGSLISDGTFLYGMTENGGINGKGVIFKIKTDGTGFSKLLDFTGSANGAYPKADLISDGTFLYGMTSAGGANNFGVIFKIKPDGTGYSKLLDFSGTSNGYAPHGSLIFDGTFLYGMTTSGGSGGDGTIFKIKPDGTGYSKLQNFYGGSDGSQPNGSLTSDGNVLYGMTTAGGPSPGGTIFKYSLVTGIKENNLETDFTVYPNPTKGVSTILLNSSENKNITIDLYDLMGNHVQQQNEKIAIGENKIEINSTKLNSGIYFLRVNNSNQKIQIIK